MAERGLHHRIVVWAAALAIAPAVISLLGWLSGADDLKSLVPGLPEMHVWTALALIALGVGSILSRDTGTRTAIGAALGLVVAILGLLFILEYLFGDLGIDKSLGADGGIHPGRPSAHAAVAMLVAGSALASLELAPPFFVPSRVLIVLTLVASISAAVGYAFGLDYLKSDSMGTAIHTAFGLLAISIALVCLRPERGIVELLSGNRPGSQLARVLLPASVLGPLALGLLRLKGQESGLFGLEVGTALLTISIIALMVPLIVFLARRLNRLDDERRRLERERTQAEAEAARIREDFLAMVSHDLRSPMAAIMGYAELLSEELQLGELGTEAVEVIERSAQRQLALLDDLLLMVQTEGSKLEISRQPFELDEIASAVITQLKPAAARAMLELRLSGEAPTVSIDRKRIEQLLDNLLSNAIKFTPPGGKVEVRLGGDGESATIEVADTGMGVPEDELPQLFDRLYRAREAKTQGIEGTGLGLSIVKRIAEAHGGRVSVTSKVGEGTVFRVTLRRQYESARAPSGG